MGRKSSLSSEMIAPLQSEGFVSDSHRYGILREQLNELMESKGINRISLHLISFHIVIINFCICIHLF